MNGQERILNIFIQLLNGKTLAKKNLMEEYQVESSSIQRSIKLIEKVLDNDGHNKRFLTSEQETLNLGFIRRDEKGTYKLSEKLHNTFLSDNEILVILKILLDSRALNKKEMNMLLTKISSLAEDKKRLNSLLSNEILYYEGVPKIDMLEKINLICDIILHQKTIEFEYTKNGRTETLQRTPTAIYFSDLYFFMISANHTATDDIELLDLNKFRINNMVNIREVNLKKNIPYQERFEGGILRKQTALPFFGHPITLVIDFYYEPAYVLDRFPNSKIISKKDGVYRMELYVNDGWGIIMWLLSQHKMVKVISPKKIKETLVELMTECLDYYDYEVQAKKE